MTNLMIVDYGIGNIQSIQNAFQRLALNKPKLSSDIHELEQADGLILPGVGAFGECSSKLAQAELHTTLTKLVIEDRKPLLGICVGMQLLANSSTEGGYHLGLGWIPGQVVKLDQQDPYPIPHVGWNNIELTNECPLYSNVGSETHYYFDHSYHFECDQSFVVAEAEYGTKITAAIQHKNIFGVQFHPEKSGNAGLKLFRNFLRFINEC